MSDLVKHESGHDAFLAGGELRILNRIPAKPLFGQYLRWSVANPVIPEKDWVEIDRRSTLGTDYIVDQDGFGACVGASAASALMRSRALRGYTFKRLSGMFVYSQINGGHDNGASIGDAVGVLEKKGACLEGTIPYSSKYIQSGNIPQAAYQEALHYTALEIYIPTTWEEMGSAIQMGFILVDAVMVGSNFNPGSDGICGFSRGPGNHAVHQDGMVKRNGQWLMDFPNTWGTSWGSQGRAYLTKQHLTDSSLYQDMYAIRVAAADPNDPDKPPVIS